MLKIIAKKEFLSLWRDRRFGIMGGIILLLLLTATVVGYLNYQKIQAERTAANTKTREMWLNQGDRNPHSAAHYGSFAYRPKSPLSFMDFGTDSYTGMSVRLEAHKQNDAQFSTAQDSSSLIRFGELTVAFVLQILMPLLIIFLCFNAFTQEKEEKTLQILLSQGVSIKQLAWGKIWGFSGVITLLVLPILALITAVLLMETDAQFTRAYLGRMAVLMACYLAYLFIYVVVSVWISARADSSRNALLTLLTVWIFTCVIIPKATVNIASNLHPIPSSFAFNQAIKSDQAKGIDGHDPEDARAKILEKQILAKYKVDSVSQLPVNFDAIQMQEGEKYTSMVYNKHFTDLQATYNAQNRVSEITSLVNPFLAIRQLSMALSGSDYTTHADFQQQAEKHRFELVALMNNYMRDHSKTGDWDFKVNKEVWSQLPSFQYKTPDFSAVINRNWLSLLSIIVWLCLGIWGISTLKFSLS